MSDPQIPELVNIVSAVVKIDENNLPEGFFWDSVGGVL